MGYTKSTGGGKEDMKIIEQDLPERKKKRIFIAVGEDEIDLLYDMLVVASQSFPADRYPQDAKRMNEMKKTLAVYSGKKKNKPPKTSEFACPQCPSYLRDEAGIAKHIKSIHSGEQKPDPRSLNV